MWLRHNCTEVSEFKTQATILTNRFAEKEYKRESLQAIVGDIQEIDRAALFEEKPTKKKKKKSIPCPLPHS